MKLDWKHIIAVVVGLILGIAGSYFGIDFKESIPSVPPLVSGPTSK